MSAAAAAPPLVLASTSRWRRELLQRLGLPFEALAPGVDEGARPGEDPASLVQRLARAKADAVAAVRPEAVVIGSDQLAELDGQRLGKPGDHATAMRQLAACSGRTVAFLTAVHVRAPGDPRGRTHLDRTEVRFRRLEEDAIRRYLQAEQPYDCAGSFRCEGLGIVLFEAIHSCDPTALVGLPLIATASLLRDAGLPLP